MTYASEVQADGPRAWYRLGESSGTVMQDSSGNGHHGSYVGSPTLGAASLLINDPGNTSVAFNGTSQHAQVNNAAWMDWGGTQFSLECWFYCTSSGSYAIVAHANAWELYFDSGQIGWLFAAGGAATSSDSGSISPNTKYHVVMTFNSPTLKIYINGTLVDTRTLPGSMWPSLTSPLVIGAWRGSDSGPTSTRFPGRIDEVAIYDTALSATRVSAHYAAGNADPPLTMSGTSSLSLGAGADVLPAIRMTGTSTLAVAATVIAVVDIDTDTSNFYDGASCDGLGLFEVFTPYTPPTVPPPVRIEKAIALPDPVLMNGRPT